MHVMVVSCVFPPEPVVSALTSSDIVEALIEDGHYVTVATSFPNRPAGKLYDGHSRRLFEREKSSTGYDIVRCFATISKTSSIFSRLLENLSFGLTSGWIALTSPRPDVFYVNTWPLIATGITYLISKWRKVPIVINIQDVYPESLISQQRIRSDGLIARFMEWLDSTISRGAKAIIVISENFANIYRNQRHVDSNNIHVINNWINKDKINISISPEEFRKKKKISHGDFLIVYGGNIGVAAGVETIISSMGYLSDRHNIRLLVAGAGSRLQACRELDGNILGECVLFHSPWLPEETSEVLRAADLLVLPTLGKQSAASVPSKLISYMLSARPVIALAVPESDISYLVEHSGCGWVVETDRPDLLAEKIEEVMRLDPAELQRRGVMGRDYALQYFANEACLPKVIKILEDSGR